MTFRDILRVCSEGNIDKPFGGKTVVFGGDFRQILPVVRKGSRQSVVNATINSSYLWSSCTVLRLTKNMRLLSVESPVEASKLKEFSSWVASVGDGIVGGPNNGEVVIDLPSDVVLYNNGDSLKTIVEKIYPSYMDPEELSNCLHDRAILVPTLDIVDEVNQFMITLDQSQGRVYLSSDSISASDSTLNGSADIHSVEFLNKLKCQGDRISMKRQLDNHGVTISKINRLLGNETKGRDHLKKCLYVVNMGSNEYVNNYLLSPLYLTSLFQTPQQFAETIINYYSQQLKSLYNYGSRKIDVYGLAPLGCIPKNLNKTVSNGSICNDTINEIVQPFNDRLKPLIDSLNADLHCSHFTMINFTSLITQGHNSTLRLNLQMLRAARYQK
ncbi:GDSL esterase/lipase At4g28780-like [Salvia splendens]|uniref:GDSL esterase/lipase At4g28780-like n=1 Tax=Salvia splendens TaxID=180675 RepID=UPI001C269F39|nr:GDSL esterase/lipase At4g28780-like [Salvia splendens]